MAHGPGRTPGWPGGTRLVLPVSRGRGCSPQADRGWKGPPGPLTVPGSGIPPPLCCPRLPVCPVRDQPQCTCPRGHLASRPPASLLPPAAFGQGRGVCLYVCGRVHACARLCVHVCPHPCPLSPPPLRAPAPPSGSCPAAVPWATAPPAGTQAAGRPRPGLRGAGNPSPSPLGLGRPGTPPRKGCSFSSSKMGTEARRGRASRWRAWDSGPGWLAPVTHGCLRCPLPQEAFRDPSTLGWLLPLCAQLAACIPHFSSHQVAYLAQVYLPHPL